MLLRIEGSLGDFNTSWVPIPQDMLLRIEGLRGDFNTCWVPIPRDMLLRIEGLRGDFNACWVPITDCTVYSSSVQYSGNLSPTAGSLRLLCDALLALS